MRLRRWGVEVFELQNPGPEGGTILLRPRFWTWLGAADHAAERIKCRDRGSIGRYSYRPVLVRSYLAAVKKSREDYYAQRPTRMDPVRVQFPRHGDH